MQEIPIGETGTKLESRKTHSWIQIWIVGVTSFLFILLQSACTVVMAVSGLRLMIGVGAFAAASGLKIFDGPFHVDAIRIPMMTVAVGGSAINLYVIWRMRSLRARSASQWRVRPATPRQKRAESIQIALAVLTLLLVAAELVTHRILYGVFYGAS